MTMERIARRRAAGRAEDEAMSMRERMEPESKVVARMAALTGLVVAAVVLGGLAPAAHAQEAPIATAVLWELGEHIDCNPGPEGEAGQVPANCASEIAKGFGTRIADAYLKGYIWGAPGSPFNGEIETDAGSILSRVDWTGPAHGKVRINNGAVHMVFSGQLNLSMAMLTQTPLAPISGTWRGTKGTYQGGGQMEGLFLIPVPGALVGSSARYVYLTLDGAGRPTGGFTPLKEGECSDSDPASRGDYHDGAPMVKLVVAFYAR
jgi:hypothetical protein